MSRSSPPLLLPTLLLLSLAALLSGCAMNAAVAPAPTPVAAGATAAQAGACEAAPAAQPESYRHKRNRFYKSLGDARFRGIDLIATEDDPVQIAGGKLAYTAADKDVNDEDVIVYACFPNGWRLAGGTRTTGDGRFELRLHGADRLPTGMRDLYAHVPGHGSGVRFLAVVAARGATAVVSDVDGTLTEGEDAIFNTVVFGDDIGHQPHAPRALAEAAASGKVIIYMTARGDQYTEVTRRWLAVHGFPRGPLRLARATITKPGPRTVAFKTGTLRALTIPLAAGIGNRASDVAAYTNAGLPPARILMNLPEFTDELTGPLAERRATAFDDYREVPALLAHPLP